MPKPASMSLSCCDQLAAIWFAINEARSFVSRGHYAGGVTEDMMSCAAYLEKLTTSAAVEPSLAP
jgi:hypothetical protein